MVSLTENRGLIIFFVVLIIASCTTNLKLEDSSIFYSNEEIDRFIKSEISYGENISKIPKEINKALVLDGISITSDTLSFNSRKHNTLLKKYAKSNDSKTGYFIVISNERLDKKNECILYRIENNRIKFTYYYLKMNQTDWNLIKPYLIPENGILRLGKKSA